MERSISQIRRDIIFRKDNFKKSEESAPEGYKFLCNYKLENENEEMRTDFRTIKWYQDNGYLIVSPAYNMYGEVLEGYVGICKKNR